MERQAFLIPKPGLLVRDPISKNPLAATGEIKPLVGPEGRYWRRRIRDKSVNIGEAKRIYRKREGTEVIGKKT